MAIIKEIKTRMYASHENMMWSVVNAALNPTNLPITSSVVPFAGYITAVQSNLTLVQTLRASISRPITGVAAQNKALKELVSVVTVNIMGAAYSYAVDNNDLVLAAKMKDATSTFEKMKNTTFFGNVQEVINEVNVVIGPLAAYAVTPEMVATSQSMLTQLMSQVADPKNGITFRKTVNIEIQSLLKSNLDTLYNNCDRLAIQFRATNLSYYNNYKSNRKLYPTSVSTQLRMWVTNAVGAPVPAGEVFILGTDRSAELNFNGYALVDHVPYGEHFVSLTTSYGTNSYGPYIFKKGKSLTLHIQVGPLDAKTAAVKVTEEEIETAE